MTPTAVDVNQPRLGAAPRSKKEAQAPEACLFPSLNEEGAGDGKYESFPIDCTHADVDAFCLKNGFDIRYFLATVLSLVVRRFADAEEVRIGLHDFNDCHGGHVGSKADMRLITASLNEKQPVRTLFYEESWTTFRGPDCASFNTGVVFDTTGHHTWPECLNRNAGNMQDTCDVILLVSQHQRGMPLFLIYSTVVLSPLHVNSVASAIAHTVSSVVGDPDQSCADISPFSQWHQTWVGTLNSHRILEPSSPYMYKMVHQNARESPGKEAVCAWDGTLTYAQLDDLSTRLACTLEDLGVTPSMMIAICFEKTLWAVVAMVAINKTGAAYVPLDPSQPLRRLEFITNKANIGLILSSERHSQVMPTITTVAVSEKTVLQLRLGGSAPRHSPHPDDPAYVLFTSGSTGQPKGCVVAHSALASVATHTGPLHIEAESRLLQFASFSFGMALIEIWCALSVGATICMPSDHDRLNNLSAAVNAMRVNWALLTPTVINSIHPRDVSYLQTLTIAGEPLRKEQIKLWSPYVQLYQAYGFTEGAGICTVSDRISSSSEQKHIGKPSNSKLWLVDPSNHSHLAPVGSVAELVVEGPHLAKGYLDEPDKTAAVFIHHPPWISLFSQSSPDRQLYKTGDLVRYNSAGSVSYIGRKDKQIKIRGHRVEVNEIEYLISKGSPRVEKVVVDLVTPADADDQPKLAAFVLPAKDHLNDINGTATSHSSCFLTADSAFTETAGAITEELGTHLPDYMVPDIFIPLNYIPVTLTGKLDRRNLQKWANDLSRDELSTLCGVNRDVLPPVTEEDNTIVRIVSSVLGLTRENVGVNHSFFRLGGDSLLAMRLVREARWEGFALTVAEVFKNPILSDLAKALAQTATKHPEETVPFQLVPGFSRQLGEKAVDQCGVRPEQIEDIYPCTALQEGLMALTARTPGAFVGRFVYRLPVETELDRFMMAWEQVVTANPIMRTRIIQLESSAMFQVVLKEGVHWDTAKDVDAYMGEIPRMILGDVLVRATVVEEGDAFGSSLFVATVHHALCDRWSLQLLLRSLEDAYCGLQPPFRPFTPFVLYTTQISGADQFWRTQFADFDAEVFPHVSPSNRAPLPKSVVEQRVLLPELSDNDFTVTTFIRLTWALVISIYSNSNHTVFGVTSAGRSAPLPDIEEITGPTVTTLPFYVHLRPRQTVHDALSSVQTRSTDMIPFEQAGLQSIRRFSPEADAACRFQSLVVVQTARAKQPMLEICQEGPAVHAGFGTYALELMCNLQDDSPDVSATVTFDTDIVSEVEVYGILRFFQHLLGELISHPQQRIDEVSLLSPCDANLLRKWNSSPAPDCDRCAHDIIRETCLIWPNAPAVDGWDGAFTYSELDNISSRLAAHLGSRCIGPKSQAFVPVLFEKSRWTVVAMLAIMKAGGAFVLLDPSQPQSRLAEICRDVDASIVISSVMCASRGIQLAEEVVVVGDGEMYWRCSENWVAPAVHPEDALYVVFTSGSTGQPKGVVIEHRGWCTSAMQQIQSLNLHPGGRTLQFSSYAFDSSVLEILATLMSGGCVCVVSEETRKTPSLLTKSCSLLNVSHAMMTPSFARLLRPNEMKGLHHLMLGGEPLTQADITRWATCVRLICAYGPCECAVTATFTGPLHHASAPNNIGYPAGSRLWVVDQQNHNRLLPVGAVGELIIEGPTVGRGYINNQEATSRAFMLDVSNFPQWFQDMKEGGGNSETRLYKTGDLGRFNNDGTICFVGRKDTQVKLRGQRIELGEVENHLRTCFDDGPATDVVAEMIRQRLICFIWQQQYQQHGESRKIMEFDAPFAKQTDTFRRSATAAAATLYDIIPGYMVPHIFVPLSWMPQTASGKVDRRYLRQSAERFWQQLEEYRVTATEKREPSGWAEETLREIWAHVLNFIVTSVGVDDNFFHLGGDSITAMQVVAQAQDRQLHHSVQDVFRLKTIAQVAIYATSNHPSTSGTEDEVNMPFQLSTFQRLYFKKMPSGRQRFNERWLLRFTNAVSPESLHELLLSAVSQHAMLRARFSVDGKGNWRQRLSDQKDASFNFQSHMVSSRQEMQVIMSASLGSLNLEFGPVFCADMITYGTEQYLFLASHCLVVDLESWNLLLEFLGMALKDGLQAIKQPMSFRTWCALEPSHDGAGENLASILPDRERLRDADFWGISDKPNTFGEASVHTFSLDGRTTTLLLDAANDAFKTKPAELVHAALLQSFTQTFHDRPAPVIFVNDDGRHSCDSNIDISQTMGPFRTIYPVDVHLSPEDDVASAVTRVKDARRCAYKDSRSDFWSSSLIPHPNSPMEILFSFCSQPRHSGEAFEIVDTSDFLDAVDPVVRFAVFEVEAFVSRGRLHLRVLFNKHARNQDLIHEWVQNFQVSLLVFSQKLKAAEARHTLSDFPLLSLTYNGLEKLLTTTLPGQGVSVNNVEDAYPCSPIQRGILLSQAKDSALYQVQFTWEVVKSADPIPAIMKGLENAWPRVVARHAILRTVFVESSSIDGYIDQVVLKRVSPKIAKVKCIESEEPISLLKKHCHNILSSELLPHSLTLCETANTVFCRLDISHALMDAASMSVITRDLMAAYEDNILADMAPLYRNYVSYVQSCSQDVALEYWKDYLDSVQPCVFPTTCSTQSGDQAFRTLSMRLSSKHEVDTYCKTNEVTVSNVLCVAWAIVLQCFTGSNDICFGYLTSGRELPIRAIHDIVGPFINMLVCRINLENGTAKSTIRKVQDDFLRSLPYQTISLADINRAMGTAAQELFNTAISVDRAYTAVVSGRSGMALKMVDRRDLAEYDIAMNVEVDDDAVNLTMRYWTSCLEDSQASSVAATFKKALSRLLADDNVSPCCIDVFSPVDKDLVWSRNHKVPQAQSCCVHEIIHQHSLIRPHAPAVCAWDGDFTYGKLDALSTGLALHLINQGIGSDRFVPLCFEKSRWTTVAQLAVMKAGGTFVLLDPSHPQQRLQTLCESVGSKLIVSSNKNAALSSQLVDNVTVIGDCDVSWCSAGVGSSLPIVCPEQPLYIVFTSGSTGKPKGVIIDHRSYATAALGYNVSHNVNWEARVLQFASYAFDVSIMESISTLMGGGCVCVLSESQRTDTFVQTVDAFKITHAFLTPSFVRSLGLEQSVGTSFPTLRTLVLGGEPITKRDIYQWKEHVQLINEYGPAECSVTASAQTDVVHDSLCNIGKPLSAVYWIVDPRNHNRLMPIGAVGELIIEGPIVGRGYINDPEKTAASFIEYPPWLRDLRGCADSSRLYKTGDLARYDTDGNVCYVGRIDTQVKLRGQRIELGEVENHVRDSFTGVTDVVADVVQPGGSGSPCLVAFILHDSVMNGEQAGVSTKRENAGGIFEVSPGNFREAMVRADRTLRDTVPGILVPALYVPVKEMPRTETGKNDRKKMRLLFEALSREELEVYRSLTPSEKQAPSTDFEQVLQGIWAQVLGISASDIGKDDNFFEMGGDSIGAMRVVSMARETGLHLTVAGFFDNPQLSAVAQSVTSGTSLPIPSTEPFTLTSVKNPMVFASILRSRGSLASQGGHVDIVDVQPLTESQRFFLDRRTIHHFVFELGGKIDVDRLRDACGAVLSKHSTLRTLFVDEVEDLPMVQVILGGPIRVPLGHVRTTHGLSQACDSLAHKDQDSMDLFDDLPLKFTLVSRSETEHAFVTRLSHAQWDGVSVGVLFRDLVGAYYCRNSLAPQNTFQDFTYYRSQQRTDAAFGFWRDFLHGSSVTKLPLAVEGRGTEERPGLVMESRSVRPVPAPPTGITLGTVVKAAWALLLAQATRQTDLVFGQTVNGRSSALAGINDILGPLLNFIPFRVKLQPSWTVLDLLRHCQKQYTQTLQYDYLDCRDIIENSTDWPTDTHLPYFIQHQNFDRDLKLALEGVEHKGFSLRNNFKPVREMFMFTSPEADRLDVELCAASNVMSAAEARDVQDRFIPLIEALTQSPPNGSLCSLVGLEWLS